MVENKLRLDSIAGIVIMMCFVMLAASMFVCKDDFANTCCSMVQSVLSAAALAVDSYCGILVNDDHTLQHTMTRMHNAHFHLLLLTWESVDYRVYFQRMLVDAVVVLSLL